ncbi:MAG TPA: radical SAM family heme chaperone HemW [Thermoanaerobaculia bacterium]|nr:radical SAM family heme chaperone HemW [Thermoanaerobaculia bacterium]
MKQPGDSHPAGAGLYVHLPFCRVRCTYCPFVVTTRQEIEEEYVDALIEEMERRAEVGAIDSLFLGGGTPSRSSMQTLQRIVGAARSLYGLAAGSEVTLEANPEDVDEANLEGWLALGVNRISLGVQSLDDSELRPLGRIHGGETAIRALTLAVASGVRTSADLILGLPLQTPESFRESLLGVIERGVGHLSLYILDLEEGTRLFDQVRSRRVSLPEDEQTEAMYLLAGAEAARAGFEQYEVSNFARPGEQSAHNLKYWNRIRYAGFGVGAHSFDGRSRQANTRDVHEYIGRIVEGESAVAFHETLSEEEARHEELFLGLRKVPGLEYADLVRLSGEEGVPWIEQGMSEGWLKTESERISFTPRGFLLSNELIARLF